MRAHEADNKSTIIDRISEVCSIIIRYVLKRLPEIMDVSPATVSYLWTHFTDPGLIQTPDKSVSSPSPTRLHAFSGGTTTSLLPASPSGSSGETGTGLTVAGRVLRDSLLS
jgi:hypothetical protein